MMRMLDKVGNRKTVIMGDFNYGKIDWENGEATGPATEFLNWVNDNFFINTYVIQPEMIIYLI